MKGRVAWSIGFVSVAALAAAPGMVVDNDPAPTAQAISALAVPCEAMPHRFSQSGDITFDGQSGLITFGWQNGETTTLDVRDADCQSGLADFVEAQQRVYREVQTQGCHTLRALVEHLRRKHGPSTPTVTVVPDDYAEVGEPSSAEKMRAIGAISDFDLAGAERTLRRDC